MEIADHIFYILVLFALLLGALAHFLSHKAEQRAYQAKLAAIRLRIEKNQLKKKIVTIQRLLFIK